MLQETKRWWAWQFEQFWIPTFIRRRNQRTRWLVRPIQRSHHSFGWTRLLTKQVKMSSRVRAYVNTIISTGVDYPVASHIPQAISFITREDKDKHHGYFESASRAEKCRTASGQSHAVANRFRSFDLRGGQRPSYELCLCRRNYGRPVFLGHALRS